jgi:outer membrane protein assembly factor BamB
LAAKSHPVKISRLSAATFVAAFSFCSSASAVIADTSTRPFRTRVLKFDDQLDAVKPLAAANHSGWAGAGNMLFGAVNDQWLGGFQSDIRRWNWWYRTEVQVSSPIAVFGTSIFFSALDGRLIRLDSNTGGEQWRANLDSFVSRNLFVNNSRVLALTARQQLYSIDAQSGTTQWLYDAGAPETIAIQAGSGPVVQGDTAYIGLSNGEIHAIQLDTGKLLWKLNPGYVDGRFHDVVGELAVFGNNLIVTRYDGLVGAMSLTESDHRLTWKEELTSLTTSVIRNGRIYVGLLNGDIHALDGASGRKLWRTQLGQAIGSIVATDENIFVSGVRGKIAKLNLESGEFNWHDNLSGSLASKPVLLETEVLFSTGLKVLYGYRIK